MSLDGQSRGAILRMLSPRLSNRLSVSRHYALTRQYQESWLDRRAIGVPMVSSSAKGFLFARCDVHDLNLLAVVYCLIHAVVGFFQPLNHLLTGNGASRDHLMPRFRPPPDEVKTRVEMVPGIGRADSGQTVGETKMSVQSIWAIRLRNR